MLKTDLGKLFFILLFMSWFCFKKCILLHWVTEWRIANQAEDPETLGGTWSRHMVEKYFSFLILCIIHIHLFYRYWLSFFHVVSLFVGPRDDIVEQETFQWGRQTPRSLVYVHLYTNTHAHACIHISPHVHCRASQCQWRGPLWYIHLD